MDVTLTAETGRPSGTRPARRLRAEGKIPGVVYGLGSEPVRVSVAWKELRKALTTDAGLNALIDLDIDGEHKLSIVKDLQRHPVRRDVLHVDFQLIDRTKTLTVDVPIVLVGTAEKVERDKGIVDQIEYTLSVNARPGAIPNQIEVDISDMEIGTTITVADLTLPEGATTDVDPEAAIATGSITRSALVADAVDAAEGADQGADEGETAEGDGAGEATDAEASADAAEEAGGDDAGEADE